MHFIISVHYTVSMWAHLFSHGKIFKDCHILHFCYGHYHIQISYITPECLPHHCFALKMASPGYPSRMLCLGWSYWQPFNTWAWLWTQAIPCGISVG